MKLYMQVCEKYTRKPLSDVFLIEALTVCDAVRQLESLSGMKVDGKITYADYARF